MAIGAYLKCERLIIKLPPLKSKWKCGRNFSEKRFEIQ
jgi:hypothetical protein